MADTGFVECRHIKAEVYNQVEEHNYLANIECDGATTDKGCFDEGSCLIQCLCGASFYTRNFLEKSIKYSVCIEQATHTHTTVD